MAPPSLTGDPRVEGVAILGCGWAGRRHARAFDVSGVRVVWAIDVDETRAGVIQQAERFGTRWDQALEDPRVQAVSVCLPHHLHPPAVEQAVAAGKHVLCEKPLAARLVDADRMADQADRAGVLLMVAENVCFDPLYEAVMDQVLHGGLGRVALARLSREADLVESFSSERPWFLDVDAAGGGMLLTGGIHDVALLRMLLGEVTEVYAVRAPQRFRLMAGEDTAVAVLRFETGAVATLVESACTRRAETRDNAELHTLTLDFDNGRLEVRGRELRVWRADDQTGLVRRVEDPDTFTREVVHFLECVQQGREPLTSGRRQRHTLEVVNACYRSIQCGRPTPMPLLP